MVLKYALLWVASFIAISAVDALWHLGLWGKIYQTDIRRVATVVQSRFQTGGPGSRISRSDRRLAVGLA